MREYKGVVWTDPLPWKDVWEQVKVGMPILHSPPEENRHSKCLYFVTEKNAPLSVNLAWTRYDGTKAGVKDFYLPPGMVCYCLPMLVERDLL